MKDLTHGPVGRHLATMALPIGVGMLLQTLYYLIDLYFVTRLGEAAVAGVSAAGNVFFLVMALTQTLNVGTLALVSHAVGRKDRADATHVFNQSLALAGLCALLTLVLGYALKDAYMRTLGADAATMAAGSTFLAWFLPGLALQFAMVGMGAALRGSGVAQPTMVAQMVSVLANAALSPVLIAGWGTGHPMGVAGAGLASSIAVAIAVIFLGVYFLRVEHYVRFDPAQWRPRWATWGRMLTVGLPSGGEFALMSVFTAVVYWIIRDFGAAAQAGFGIGSRIMQALFLPAMAVAFAASPVAGQNVGARLPERVRATFRGAAGASAVLMAGITVLCQFEGETLLRAFVSDRAVLAVATEFLTVISWNFVGIGLVFTCSSLFQALGNTVPSLLCSLFRVVAFALPVVWLSTRPGFALVDVWHVSVVTVILQAALALVLLRREFARKLPALAAAT